MEIKDISQNGKRLFKVEDQEKPWNTSGSLKEIGKEKIDSLKEEVKEIEELVENREKLSKELFREADKVKMEINNFLAETHPVDIEGIRDKVTLKQKQVEISELQLKEKISCWQDIAKLKQELRECKKELAGREGRLDMLGKILED